MNCSFQPNNAQMPSVENIHPGPNNYREAKWLEIEDAGASMFTSFALSMFVDNFVEIPGKYEEIVQDFTEKRGEEVGKAEGGWDELK